MKVKVKNEYINTTCMYIFYTRGRLLDPILSILLINGNRFVFLNHIMDNEV